MLDGTAPHDRIVAAALRLAERKGWASLSLGEIAAEADVPLARFRHNFRSKTQILAAFTRATDRAMLDRAGKPDAGTPRDRLFDVVLTRFEIMEPYKRALRRIRDESGLAAFIAQLGPGFRSQYWMLAAAGINGEGTLGLLRVEGLLAIYARVFSIWLDDDDPGMARVMAALDRRLRRGENIMRQIESAQSRLRRVAQSLAGNGKSAGSAAGDETRDEQAGKPPEAT